MRYEDQLYVWCLLLRNKLAGQIAPAHPKDNRALEYALLVPEEMAVDEINAITDVEPITRKMLTAIVREITGKAPPYPQLRDRRPRGLHARADAQAPCC